MNIEKHLFQIFNQDFGTAKNGDRMGAVNSTLLNRNHMMQTLPTPQAVESHLFLVNTTMAVRTNYKE